MGLDHCNECFQVELSAPCLGGYYTSFTLATDLDGSTSYNWVFIDILGNTYLTPITTQSNGNTIVTATLLDSLGIVVNPYSGPLEMFVQTTPGNLDERESIPMDNGSVYDCILLKFKNTTL